MDISKDGKHVLGEFFHSHDGVINISVRQASSGVTSPATYTIGATMDDLTNAWIADPGSLSLSMVTYFLIQEHTK
jgi:hypothetical protein